MGGFVYLSISVHSYWIYNREWFTFRSYGVMNKGVGCNKDFVGGVAEVHEDACSLDSSAQERSTLRPQVNKPKEMKRPFIKRKHGQHNYK